MLKRNGKSMFMIIVLLIMITLTACSEGAVNEAAEGGNDSDVKMETVKVWTNSGHSKEVVTQMVDEFNQTIGKEKGIHIEYTVHGGDYVKLLEVAIASDQTPDLFKAVGSLGDNVKKGALLAIDDMPGGKEFLAQYEGLLDNPSFSYDGKTYLVPSYVNTFKLLYNKEMFKEAGIVDANGEAKPPATWEEVAEYAKKLTNPKEKQYGIALPMKWSGYFDMELLMPFVSSIGHEIFDYKSGQFNFSAFQPAMEWLLQIKQDKSYFPGAEGLDNDPARAQFAEGRIGMKFGASWDVGVLNDQFPAKMDWGVAAIPVSDPASKYKEFTQASGWTHISKSAGKNNLEKVMEVYRWFNSDEVLVKLYEESKFIPYKDSIVKKATKQPEKKGWAEFADISNSYQTLTTPSVKIEGDDYKQVLMKIWAGVTTLEDGFADLDERYNRALQQGVNDGTLDLEPFINESFSIRVQ
ncbi:sugar ABC transporter substrate-binding protein [Paenibacillus sp. J5C_2022]|uniref:ABC transporter substrate-binding protein n=1 Tax=Paenibacillus sp. J5C2022 TaxID=2977129 RepID=UPI0021D109D5|nr:sugar ABC transporter substrate-binding protein [Paenibacillus sp. J5C2022]MCU6710237.1 sugar ABC transporter substrate-binding protein [Paenibacillus sp. J5C2022]